MRRSGIAGLVGAVGVAGATISLGLASTSAQAVAGGHTGWSLQHPAIPAGSSKTYLDGVSCFVACTSVGAYVKGTSTVPLAERWGGKKWAIQHPRPPKGSKNAQLRGVSCFSARICTAVGFAVGPVATSWLWSSGGRAPNGRRSGPRD